MSIKKSVSFEGWTTPPDFISDGCSFAPDRWLTLRGWVKLTDACILHDFLRIYALVTTKEADKILRRHLISIGAPLYLAWIYWVVVKKARRYFNKTYELPYRWNKYKKPTGNK